MTGDATTDSIEALREIVERSWITNVLQLISAILMIGVELCLMWAIFRLIKHVNGLTCDLELMLDNMGWRTGKHADRMAKTRAALEQQQFDPDGTELDLAATRQTLAEAGKHPPPEDR